MTHSVPPSFLTAVPPRSTRTVFAQTMGFVAATAAAFALGSYLGRDLVGGVGILAFVLALASLFGMQYAASRSPQATVALLGAFGLLLGIAFAPTLSYYASVDPAGLWRAACATALFIAVFGSAGYATERDLSVVARVSTWGLVGLFIASFVLVFVTIPGGSVVFSLIGLVVFAGYTLFDFQRLRRSQDVNSSPFLAASIFLDILNVFLFFLGLTAGDE